MAVLFKDVIQKQQEYLEAEGRKKVTETISSAELKQLMAQAIEMGGDVNENVIKLYDEMRKQTNILQKEQKDQLVASEEKQEAAKVDQDQTDLLEQIADNTKVKPEKDTSLGLGTIVASLTAALAGLVGVVSGYVKSIKVLLDVFTPEFIKTKLTSTIESFGKTLSEFGTKLRNVFTKGIDKITAFFTEGLGKLKTLFTFDEASKIGKFISVFKEGFSKLFAPFSEAFTVIKDLMSGATKGLEFVGGIAKRITSTIGTLAKTISSIAVLFKGIVSVVSKIATPLFVIMTLWDTVSNVIDRFESDGIIGGFVGIFEGLLKSIVAAPLDLLKDLVSWVLGKFGFDQAEQFLDSFSFVDIVTGFFDAILNPIDTIVNMFEGVVDLVDEYIIQPLADAFAPITDFFVGIKDSIVGFFEAIEIPKIGFTIPIIDKEVSIGPFYPFRREKPAEAEVGVGKTAAAEASAPQKGSREEYDVAYKNNLEKTGGNERVAQKLTALDVGLAPGTHPDTLPRTETSTVTAKGAGVSQDMLVPGGTVIPQATGPETEARVKGAGVSQDMLVPGGTVIPQATGPETREQTEARVKGALKAGVEEAKADVKAIESGVTINGEVAPTSRQEYYKQQGFTPDQIANLNARQAKIDALRSQDPNAKIDKDLAIMDSEAVALSKQAEDTRKISPDEIKKEAQAYTSKLNIAEVLQAPQSISGATAATTSSAANMVYGASAENAEVASMPQQTSSTNNTVVAPTTVNNNTVNSYKPDVRNQDSSFRRMLDQRYVRV